ncbi:MAG: transposase [Muribaculaceae bacterium]|nr:transposase [Muribaculaceae bacterium]
MAQSLCKIYLHIIFHTKTTSPVIMENDIERLHQYIGQLINSTGSQTIIVGGVNDHVHALCTLGRSTAVSHLVEEIKRNSSRWIKTLSPRYAMFAWQGGYAALSVSQSVVDKTINYIKTQKEHHQKTSYNDEFKKFMDLYQIKFDEKYAFCD